MKNILFILTSAICLCFHSTGHAHSMADRLQYLLKGDTVLFDLGNSIAVIEVCDTQDGSTELRVVGATKDILDRHHDSTYTEWLAKGCKDAQFDERLRTQDQKGIVQSSLVHAKWFETLLQLDLFKIPSFSRRKVGPAPLAGEIDLRKTWHPPLIVSGQCLKAECDAFSAKWPDDGSPLASRVLILYFPKSSQTVQGLPYWIESPSTSFHVAVIDSKKADTCEHLSFSPNSNI